MEYEDKFQYVQIAYKIEGEFKKGTKRLKELRGEIASLHCDQSTKTRLQEKYEGLLKMTQNRIDYTDPLNPSQVQNLNRSFAGFNKQLQEIDFDHGLDATVYDNTFWEIALQTKKQEIKHIFPGDNADNLIRSICDRYGVPAPSDEPVSDEPVLDTLASD